ncbi:hypothetical protein E2C01_098372 [Portunus trituberculatus]|uniref:Uncharacterized protein n=1 Tax=Portunus trituberculatus TaxID=210409 RepID=A0A5B7KBX9_PORTR|nr:hypothetical protein [Portunus trituberculatus]
MMSLWLTVLSMMDHKPSPTQHTLAQHSTPVPQDTPRGQYRAAGHHKRTQMGTTCRRKKKKTEQTASVKA